MMKIINFKFLILKKSQKGFTLVELLIYIGLLTILITALTQVFSSILDALLESKEVSSVQQDGRFILSRLSYDINRADDIVIPASLGSQSNSLQLDIGGISYVYSISGTDLIITDNFGTNKLNGYNTEISNLNFTRLGNGVANAKNNLRIEYTITSKTIRPSGQEIKNFQTTIGLR